MNEINKINFIIRMKMAREKTKQMAMIEIK